MTEREKAIDAATEIKGKMPAPDAYKAEQAKWDSKGHLIDKDEIEKEQRQRDLALGKVEPEASDYPTKEMRDKLMPSKKRSGDPDSARAIESTAPPTMSAEDLAGKNNEKVPVPAPQVDPAFIPAEEAAAEAPAKKASTTKKTSAKN